MNSKPMASALLASVFGTFLLSSCHSSTAPESAATAESPPPGTTQDSSAPQNPSTADTSEDAADTHLSTTAAQSPGETKGETRPWPSSLQKWAERAALRFSVPNVTAINIPDHAILIDVRSAEETEVSQLTGAKLLNTDPLRQEFLQQGATVPIVVYCTVGWRSSEYAQKLREKGFDAYNLSGGLCAWANAGQPIVDSAGKTTRRIHSYSKDFADCVPATHHAVVE